MTKKNNTMPMAAVCHTDEAIIGDLRFALQGDPRWRHAFGATDTPSQLRNIFRVNNPIKVLVIEQAIEPRETEQVWTEATEDPSILTVVVARSVREQKRIKPTDRRIVLGPDSESGEIVDAIRTLRIRRGEKARAAFETGVLWLDPATGRVRAHNRDVKITDNEFQLLAILADQPFRLFPKDELAMTITGGTSIQRSDIRFVEKVAHQLRKTLAAAHVDAVIEPAGLGFQLFPTVVAKTSDSPVFTKVAA